MISFYRFACIFLLISAALTVHGQDNKEDYVVTMTEDTIYGKLTAGLLGRPKLITENDKITCNPKKIQAYYRASKKVTYRAILLPNHENNQWAEVLEDGAIKLYYVNIDRYMAGGSGVGYTSSSTYWYASKVGVGLVEIKTSELALGGIGRKKRKEHVRALFEDDEVVLKAFEEIEEYSFDNLQKLIKLYNERAAKKGNPVTS